jgi:hypothetical protein
LVGKSDGKKPLLRTRHKWEDNIRRDLKEIRWEGVDWMHLTKVKDQWWDLVNMVMNLQVP